MTVGETPRWVTRWRSTMRPQAVRSGEVRRALVEHQPGAAQERPGDRPGAHHPAEVGEPEEAVAGAEVEVVGEVLRGLDREAAVDMDGALGPAGRPGRVDEHERGLGVDVAGLGELVCRDHRRTRQRLVPPDVAPGRPRRVDRIARPPDDEDVPHRRHRGDRRVGDALQRDPRTPPEEPVGGDEGRGVAVGEPGRDGRRAVAAEDRGEDGPDPGRGRASRSRSRAASAAGSRRGRRHRSRARAAAGRPPRPRPRARRWSGGAAPRPRPPSRARSRRGDRSSRAPRPAAA